MASDDMLDSLLAKAESYEGLQIQWDRLSASYLEMRTERDTERERREKAEAERDAARAQRNAIYNASELGRIADELDEDNAAMDAAYVRAAAASLARLEEALAKAEAELHRWRKGSSFLDL